MEREYRSDALADCNISAIHDKDKYVWELMIKSILKFCYHIIAPCDKSTTKYTSEIDGKKKVHVMNHCITHAYIKESKAQKCFIAWIKVNDYAYIGCPVKIQNWIVMGTTESNAPWKLFLKYTRKEEKE